MDSKSERDTAIHEYVVLNGLSIALYAGGSIDFRGFGNARAFATDWNRYAPRFAADADAG